MAAHNKLPRHKLQTQAGAWDNKWIGANLSNSSWTTRGRGGNEINQINYLLSSGRKCQTFHNEAFWQQDCCSRIYLRFLPFAFVNRAGEWVWFRGDVPCWTRRHSPWLPAARVQTPAKQNAAPGLRENTSQQLRAKPEHNISVWTDFSAKGFDCWFSKGCFNEIYLLYGNINSVFGNSAQN